jgi:7-cyano-7-deazaguanine synthase
MDKAVVVISGGLDSSTLAHLVAQTHEVYGISFDYGQRHKRELRYAAYQMALLGDDNHKIVDMSFMTDLLAQSGSALVTDEDVPDGHYAEDSMKKTVVPNRNMIMLSIASAYAISIGATSVYLGVHAGDHFIYPDCRPRFLSAANAAVVLGNEGFGPIPEQCENSWPTHYLQTPFIDKSKNDIATLAFSLNVDVSQTWSCYKGGDIHCGKCGTCVERLEAINSTGYEDPTPYEDDTYWRSVLEKGQH